MNARKIITFTALSAVVLLGLFGLAGPGAAQEPVTLTFDPVEVGVAETALLQARIDCPGGNCGSFHIVLSFDRELIRVRRAEVGPYLGDQAFEATNNIDNPAGKVELAAESVAPPPDAENLLFTLEVYGLVPGTSPITVDLLDVNNVTRTPVPAASTGTEVTVFETGKIAFFSPPSDDWEVVFVSDRDGNPEIYAMSADGSNVRRLTDHEMLDGGPQWSPDGSQIVFFSARDGNFEIYVMDENGDTVRRLTDHPAPDYDPAWSADGSQIVFVSERDDRPELYVVPASGGEPTRLTDTPDRKSVPAWSPDRRVIAYNAGGSPVVVQVMNPDGTGVRQLVDLFGANGLHPDWSPNAALISLAVERDGNTDIYTMQRDGSAPTRLTTESSWPTTTAFAPDGNWIGYLAGYTGFSDLYVINTAGERIFRLTETEFDDAQPDWRTISQPLICSIRTDRKLEIELRVGPGVNRGVFGFLPPDLNVTVQGQALDNDGNVWYELDKTQIPGTEMVNSLWVRAEDVLFSGSCANVAFAEPPPFIPDTSTVPDTPPGTWGGCGSCDTCGHPGECVTSPDGVCMWDPGTCHVPPPDIDVTPPPGSTPPPQTACYRLALGSNGPGSVSASPGYNCQDGSGYAAGTVVTITGTPQQGAFFDDWSGTCPGANSSSNPLVITMSMTCSVTGYFDYFIIN